MMMVDTQTVLPPRIGSRIDMVYIDSGGHLTRRSVEPLRFTVSSDGTCYMRAFCHLRHDERTFRMDRVLSWTEHMRPVTGQPLPTPVPAVQAVTRRNHGGTVVLIVFGAAILYGLLAAHHGAESPPVAGTQYRQEAAVRTQTAPDVPSIGTDEGADTYRGYAIERVRQAGSSSFQYRVRALGYTCTSLRTAHLAVNAELFIRQTGIRDHRVLSLYAAADSDGNGNLSWAEIVRFQSWLEHTYRYQANSTALRPDEFLAQGGGDCEDWAIMTAGLLEYWGWNASIAVFTAPDSRNAHAVCMVWSPQPIPGYGSFDIRQTVALRSGELDRGFYIPIDYQSVGALTNAVGKGWTLTAMYAPVSLYDVPM